MANRTLEYLLTIKDQATATLQKFSKNADNIGKSFDKAGKSINDAGMGMVKIGATGTVALGLAAKTAIDFEDALTGVAKTSGLAGDNLKIVSDGLLEQAKNTRTSISELQEISRIAGQLGVGLEFAKAGQFDKQAEEILAFTETINMAVVALGDEIGGGAETITAELGKIADASGLIKEVGASEAINKIGSAINELGASGNATAGYMVDFAKRTVGMASALGIPTESILALGASLEESGVSVEVAGTNFNTLLQRVGKDVPTFAKAAGVSVSEFSDMLATQPVEALTLFANNLAEANPTIEEMSIALDDLGLGGGRVGQVLFGLASSQDKLAEKTSISSKAFDEATSLQTEYNKVNNTTKAEAEKLRNNMQVLGITLGSVLLPAINKTIEALKPAIEAFTNFTAKHPKLVVGVLAVIASIGVLGTILIFIGQMFMAVGAIIPVVGAVLGAITLPIALVIGAIVALIAVGVLIYKNWDKIKAKAKELGSAIKNGLTNAWNSVKQFMNNLKQFGSNVMTAIQGGITSAQEGIRNFFVNLGTGAMEGITQLFETIKTIFTGAIALLWEGDFTGEFGRALGLSEDSPIITGVLWLRDQVINAFTMMVEGVMIAIMPFVFIWENIVFPILFLAFAVITRIIFELGLFIWEQFQLIWLTISTVFLMIWEFTMLVWNSIYEFLIMLFTSIYESVVLPIMMMIQTIITAIWTAIKTVTMTIWNAIKAFITTTFNAVVTLVNNLKARAVALFNALWSQVKAIWSGIANTIKQWITQAKEWLTTIVTNAKERVLSIFEALWQGIKSIGEKIYQAIIEPFVRALEKVKEIASKIKEAAKKISPFHKSSPSLVELVQTGMAKIRREYDSLNRVNIPSAQQLAGVPSFAPLSSGIASNEAGSGRTTNNTINVDATINTPMDAEELALILGNQLATSGTY